jgi:hypothetical protein
MKPHAQGEVKPQAAHAPMIMRKVALTFFLVTVFSVNSVVGQEVPNDVYTFDAITTDGKVLKFQFQASGPVDKANSGFPVKGFFNEKSLGRVLVTGRLEMIDTTAGETVFLKLSEDTRGGRFKFRIKRDTGAKLIAEAYYFHPANPAPVPVRVDTKTLAVNGEREEPERQNKQSQRRPTKKTRRN